MFIKPCTKSVCMNEQLAVECVHEQVAVECCGKDGGDSIYL